MPARLPQSRMLNDWPALGVKPLISETSSVPSSVRSPATLSLIVLRAGRSAADFDLKRCVRAEHDIAGEVDGGRAAAGAEVAFEVHGAGAGERAAAGDAAEEDGEAVGAGADFAVVGDVVVEDRGAAAAGDDLAAGGVGHVADDVGRAGEVHRAVG